MSQQTLTAIQQYDDVSDAVKGTLKVLALTAHKASPEMLQKEGYAITVSKTARLDNPLIVFDIDETLVLDDSKPLPEVIALLKRLRAVQCRIFLVTARHTSARQFTVKELTSVGITPDLYDGLVLCPKEYRDKGMKAVGEWKKSQRQAFANQHQMPVLLTVGDQWTDLLQVKNIEELNDLDEAYGTQYSPWILLRLRDGVGIYGLKLRPPTD